MLLQLKKDKYFNRYNFYKGENKVREIRYFDDGNEYQLWMFSLYNNRQHGWRIRHYKKDFYFIKGHLISEILKRRIVCY